MVEMAALINWEEMCWGVTGDTGSVEKVGQCQTLQPRLSPFLIMKNTFFQTLTHFISAHQLCALPHPHLYFFLVLCVDPGAQVS